MPIRSMVLSSGVLSMSISSELESSISAKARGGLPRSAMSLMYGKRQVQVTKSQSGFDAPPAALGASAEPYVYSEKIGQVEHQTR